MFERTRRIALVMAALAVVVAGCSIIVPSHKYAGLWVGAGAEEGVTLELTRDWNFVMANGADRTAGKWCIVGGRVRVNLADEEAITGFLNRQGQLVVTEDGKAFVLSRKP